MPLILVVDDDPNIVRILTGYLKQGGFEVLTAGDGLAAMDLARRRRPDLVVLDLMLPQLDGLEVCRRLRQDSDVPVLMLTARSEDTDKLVGLHVGADDYVTKPFNPREVVARVTAILRRSSAAGGTPVLREPPLELDPDARLARKSGADLGLTALEFDLLATFMARPGRVWTREELLDRCWGAIRLEQHPGDPRVVDVHIANLRKKLEDEPANPRLLQTVRGVGYKFVPGE
jgi:DNA-binding response OmpR family regulator